MTDALIAKLTGWGCDTQGALRRLLGNRERYIDCVRQAAGDLENLELLCAAAARGESERAFEMAHYHKGSLANLGLTPLLAPMSAATEILREGTTAGTAPLMDELRARKAELDDLLAGGSGFQAGT